MIPLGLGFALMINGCSNTELTPSQRSEVNADSAKIGLETECILEAIPDYTGRLPFENIEKLTPEQMEAQDEAVAKLKKTEGEAIQTAKRNIEQGKTVCQTGEKVPTNPPNPK